MIAVKLQGGIGNQMFQYTAAKALAFKNKSRVCLDLSFLEETAAQTIDGFTKRFYELGIFKNIDQQFISAIQQEQFTGSSAKKKWLKRLGFAYPKNYKEPGFEFDDAFFFQKAPVLLDGYWQSERYFLHESATIRSAFDFPGFENDEPNKETLQGIKNTLAVSVHVRRADYLHPAIAAQHGSCSESYYKEAIELMRSSFPQAVFYFFTDDPAWVESIFTSKMQNVVLVKNNTGINSWKDMYLMSNCRHHIIANSSFSWWGAWLNDRPDKQVIAPAKWFEDNNRNEKDLIPTGWIQL